MKSVDFSYIQKEASYKIHQLTEPERDNLFEELEHGVSELHREDLLDMYMYAYGKMHQEKLNLAFGYIDDYILETKDISIIDYGCGQGLASIVLADFMRQHECDIDCIKNITLIEPSKQSLKRAETYVQSIYGNGSIKVVNKDLNNLEPDDVLSKSPLTIHLFSNILDIQSINLKRLSTVINISRIPEQSHVFVCVGPYFGISDKDMRLHNFCSNLCPDDRDTNELHFEKGRWKNDWSCSLVIKQSISSSLIVQKHLKGALSGDPSSQFQLGRCYLYGIGIERNFQQAIYWLERAAQGTNDAEYELAGYYSEGLYCEPNYPLAITWYKKAAKIDSYAKRILGDIYFFGIGVEKDLEKAKSYYQSFIENNKNAEYGLNKDLTVLLAENEKIQENLIENIKKAEMSDITALNELAHFYMSYSPFENYRKAYHFYEKAAELGDIDAQVETAYFYLLGEGKKWGKNPIIAIEWLKMASNEGHEFAQFTLGKCYEDGIGVEKNITEAVKFYALSAEQGNVEAQMKLGDLFFSGFKVIKNYNEAFKWYKLICENNAEYYDLSEAFYRLGYCLFYGLGCSENKDLAVQYLADCIIIEPTCYKCLPLLHSYCISNPEILEDLYRKDIHDFTWLDSVLEDYKDYLFSD